MRTQIVEIEFHSFWHIGTGRSSGAGVDSLQFSDVDKLPIWPGKSLKGVFRDAFAKAVKLDSLPHNRAELNQLFGPWVAEDSDDNVSEDGDVKIRFQKALGAFRFSDARLATPERMPIVSSWAKRSENRKSIDFLYTEVANIRLEEGVAAAGALRMVQLTKPITLYAEVSYVEDTMTDDATEMNSECAFARLQTMLPLVRLAGASRTRGLGRLTARFYSETEGA